MILKSPKKSEPFFRKRRERLRSKIVGLHLDGALITNINNVSYLSGFAGTSAMMVITPGKDFFFTDFRYTSQAQTEVIGPEIIEYKDPAAPVLQLVKEEKMATLGFEADHVSVTRAEKIKKELGGATFQATTGLVESIRIIKDEPEIEAIKALLSMLAETFPVAIELIRPGAIERDVALELEYRLRKLGADGPAFDFILASGARSAIPHGIASEKIISTDEMVTLDWGAKALGYYSDNTRTIALGNVDSELLKIYDIVLEANRAAIEFVRPGVTTKEIDNVARSIIKKAGYGGAFGHGTGHGVGLDIHENPRVSWNDGSVVEDGMVFTIEPGIYLPKKGGVRIEDMVIVTKTGHELLSGNIPKDLIRL
ncbi:Aminopeptidase YpdF (MP-, MA-, MS-, AP-, NP-specific) [hydrothermal vent metagenome]|uniref:Aminopeptidase YpdF (MP-, MA-, MS-, AP-, NP-specific) n=1 Tax=hydrothermal vent metagenome TaxID=652676 RepID=A0A3B1BIE8_9ZZZZ